jgi:hypothetical protein
LLLRFSRRQASARRNGAVSPCKLPPINQLLRQLACAQANGSYSGDEM